MKEELDSHRRMEKMYAKYMEEVRMMDTLPDRTQLATTLRTIADRVVNATSYTFCDTETQAIAETLSDDQLGSIQISSGFNDWKYWNGVIHLAFLQLAALLKEPAYQTYVLRNYAFIFDHLPFFRAQYEQGNTHGSLHQFFCLDRLDDCGAMDAGLIAAHQLTPRPEYQQRIKDTARYITERQNRLADGTFCRIHGGKTTVWADDAYMSIPFLVRMRQHSGQDIYFEDAVNMALNVHTHLFDQCRGLYFHCYYPALETHGVAYWGRANGWVVMALTDLLLHLPEDHAARAQLLKNLREHLIGLTRYQHPCGLWHQLLDKPNSFLESSATAMFIYGFATAIRQGWLDEMYSPVAVRAWNALSTKIRSDGQIEDISLGFNLRADLPFYYQVPPVLDDPHGIGAVLMAGMAMYQLPPFDPWVWE